MSWISLLQDFFLREAPLGPDDRLAVAFSGGGDSTALLWGLAQLPGLRPRLVAVHVDHALDPGSAERARQAQRLATEIGVPCQLERRDVPALAEPGEGLEAAARRLRYAALDAVRHEVGARYVATAHHRDDQAETVVLRLRFGSGLYGLGGIRPVHGAVVRPLLAVPRAALALELAGSGLTPVDDPTNRDLASSYRNRIRHRILPALAAEDPALPLRLAALAERARRAAGAFEERLADRLQLARRPDGGVGCSRERFRALPEAARPLALSLLARRAGAAPSARRTASAELLGQLARGGRVALDAGGGWRLRADENALWIEPRQEKAADFSYTLEVPGELCPPGLPWSFRLSHRPVEPWMFRGDARRAALALPLVPGDRVTVRNRRPGDRVRPLGAAGSRRLKEVLIDRHVPAAARARIPLLCCGGEVAWVPGVAIAHDFRITGETVVWLAEIADVTGPDSGPAWESRPLADGFQREGTAESRNIGFKDPGTGRPMPAPPR
jgi:tRNA(Ile)-lysidine synthase